MSRTFFVLHIIVIYLLREFAVYLKAILDP